MRKAFFLDRDGVINECHSVNKVEEFHLLEGVPQAIAELNKLGYQVFVVTNQGGVGLGYMSEDALADVHLHMLELISEGGGTVTEVRSCIHRPHDGCRCRKPKPGMMLSLMKKYGIDKEGSFMVGDRDVDIKAGRSADLRTVFIGAEAPSTVQPDYVFASLSEAVAGLKAQGVIGEMKSDQI